MYSKEMIAYAINQFTKNPYWREEYETAPSDICKQRVALDFCFSTYYGQGYNDDDERKRLESQLDLGDWKHLLKYSGNNPWRTKCKQKIAELEAMQGQER